MDTKVKGINLLPNEYIVEQKVALYQKIISAVALVEVACFIGFVALPPKQEVIRTQDELLEKQSQLSSPRYAGVNKTLSDLETTKTEIQNWLSACNSINGDEFIEGKLLDAMTVRVPAGVAITTMEIDDSQGVKDNVKSQNIEMTGMANRPDEIMNYVSVIETLFPAYSISHTFEWNKDEQKYNFTISINLQSTVITQGEQNATVANTASDTSSDDISATPSDSGEGDN